MNTHDRLVREIAVGAHVAVVFVDFDRSPEAQFPIPVEEAYAATKYVAENGSVLNVDGSRLAVLHCPIRRCWARIAPRSWGLATRVQIYSHDLHHRLPRLLGAPDGALAQVEGAALWGVSLTLHEGSEFVKGRVKDTNLDTYTPLRMGDVPEMDIEFLPSTEVPTGLGEPATTVVGPAIGNAIFAATGARLRHLPIRPDAVLRALNTKS
jgi:hypothetical protein